MKSRDKTLVHLSFFLCPSSTSFLTLQKFYNLSQFNQFLSHGAIICLLKKWSQMIIWRAKLKIAYILEIKAASSSLALDRVFGLGENYPPKKKQTLLLLCVCVCMDQLWDKQHSLTVAGHESACWKYLSQEKYHKLNRTISHKTSATIWPWP